MKPTVKTNELNKPKVDLDYTKTRPKRLNKFEKVGGMKVVKAGWVEPEKIKKPELLRATTIKGRKKEMRRNAAEKAYKERQKLLHGSVL